MTFHCLSENACFNAENTFVSEATSCGLKIRLTIFNGFSGVPVPSEDHIFSNEKEIACCIFEQCDLHYRSR